MLGGLHLCGDIDATGGRLCILRLYAQTDEHLHVFICTICRPDALRSALACCPGFHMSAVHQMRVAFVDCPKRDETPMTVVALNS